MDQNVDEQISRYFGDALVKLRILGITKYSLYTYVRRVREGQSKRAAQNGLLQGRTLDPEQIEFVQTVLDRLPPQAMAAGGSYS